MKDKVVDITFSYFPIFFINNISDFFLAIYFEEYEVIDIVRIEYL